MKLFIYTDGGARGNPGPAATGIVITDENKTILASYGEYLGTQTNNVAEYRAIISGLKRAKSIGGTDIVCYADSKLVIEQLKGKWKVKAPHLYPLFLEAWNLLHSFKVFTLAHIPREKNKAPDAEVNKILDSHK